MLSTLEEVALHQQNIEKIEAIGQLCPHLRILYLQNNLISKIQNLHKLKVLAVASLTRPLTLPGKALMHMLGPSMMHALLSSQDARHAADMLDGLSTSIEHCLGCCDCLQELQYLNLAVNNITKLQNLQRCESLQKLDVTINFIPKAGLLSLASLNGNYNLRELFLIGNPCTDWSGYRQFVVATLPQLHKLVRKQRSGAAAVRPLQQVKSAVPHSVAVAGATTVPAGLLQR